MEEKACNCCESCNCGCKKQCCCAYWALVASGIVFSLFGLENLYLYVHQIAVLVNTTVLPVSYSAWIFLASALMALWCFFAAHKLRKCSCKTCKCDCHHTKSEKD